MSKTKELQNFGKTHHQIRETIPGLVGAKESTETALKYMCELHLRKQT